MQRVCTACVRAGCGVTALPVTLTGGGPIATSGDLLSGSTATFGGMLEEGATGEMLSSEGHSTAEEGTARALGDAVVAARPRSVSQGDSERIAYQRAAASAVQPASAARARAASSMTERSAHRAEQQAPTFVPVFSEPSIGPAAPGAAAVDTATAAAVDADAGLSEPEKRWRRTEAMRLAKERRRSMRSRTGSNASSVSSSVRHGGPGGGGGPGSPVQCDGSHGFHGLHFDGMSSVVSLSVGTMSRLNSDGDLSHLAMVGEASAPATASERGQHVVAAAETLVADTRVAVPSPVGPQRSGAAAHAARSPASVRCAQTAATSPGGLSPAAATPVGPGSERREGAPSQTATPPSQVLISPPEYHAQLDRGRVSPSQAGAGAAGEAAGDGAAHCYAEQVSLSLAQERRHLEAESRCAEQLPMPVRVSPKPPRRFGGEGAAGTPDGAGAVSTAIIMSAETTQELDRRNDDASPAKGQRGQQAAAADGTKLGAPLEPSVPPPKRGIFF